MPNTKSAAKRLKQNTERRAAHRSVKRAVRTRCRRVAEAIKAGDAEQAEAAYQVAVKSLDRAGTKNIIHRNAAARLKSRMTKKIKALKQA